MAHAHAQSFFLAVKPVTPVVFISYTLELLQGRKSYRAIEASPTLGCSIEISRDICCRYVGMSEYVCPMLN